MAGLLRKVPETIYIPGRPAVAAQPKICWIEYGQQIGVTERTEFRWVPKQEVIWFPGNPLTGEPAGWKTLTTSVKTEVKIFTPIYREKTVCSPAVAGQPAVLPQVITSTASAWGDGARLVTPLRAGEFVDLDITRNPIAVMLAVSPRVNDYSLRQFRHGVIVRPDGVYAVQGGVDLERFDVWPATVRMARTEHEVIYFADGMRVHSYPVTGGGQYVYVALYAMSDYVDNPRFGRLAGGESAFVLQTEIDPTPRGTSIFRVETQAAALADGVAYAGGMSTFRLQSSARAAQKRPNSGVSVFSVVTKALGYLGAGSGTQYGEVAFGHGKLAGAGMASEAERAPWVAQGTFSRPVLQASMGRAEAFATTAEGLFMPPSVDGWLLSGGTLSGEGVLPVRMAAAESADYFGGLIEYRISPEAGGLFFEGDPTLLSHHSRLGINDVMELEQVLVFSFVEHVEAGIELDLYMMVSLSMMELVMVEDSTSLASTLELMIRERLLVSPELSTSHREAIQYAVNAATGALSRYSGFGFTQFARAGCNTYAITEDGLYRLDGDTDDGQTIAALIDFGASDYGSAASKRISSIYAGINTDGAVYFRLTEAGGTERVYRAIEHTEEEARTRTAKGIASRHWRLRLELVDASFADLDNVEVEVGVGRRRVGR